MDAFAALARLPTPVLLTLTPFLVTAVTLSIVRVYTSWSYYQTLKGFKESSEKPGSRLLKPPQIPYTLPWLGNTLTFLTKQPGQQWKSLFSWHPRSTGICTLLVGGKKIHIIFSPSAVVSIFKNGTMKRDEFEHDLYTKIFELPHDQIVAVESGKHSEPVMNAAYLTRPERVNELTTEFMSVLKTELRKDVENVSNVGEVGLYKWLRNKMFTASVVALHGEYMLQLYPGFYEDFFLLDQDFLKFFFGLPKAMMRDSIERRERCFRELAKWNETMLEKSGGEPVDPEGVAWEPFFGSRLSRARHVDYRKRGMNLLTSAAFDFGMTFGLASNVIPATGWMLLHILDPGADKTLYPRVMAELQKAARADGKVDVPTLVNSPLLQSIWTEVLRLHVDVLVTRNLTEDVVLPMDEDGKITVQLKKGDSTFAPSWLGHHDPNAWAGQKVASDVFWAERFLDDHSGEFSMAGTVGKFFPFGGGRTICPGRVFAKQEALGGLAMVLLSFDFEVTGFTDVNGEAVDAFPGYLDAYPGSAALVPGGDIVVKLKSK